MAYGTTRKIYELNLDSYIFDTIIELQTILFEQGKISKRTNRAVIEYALVELLKSSQNPAQPESPAL